MSEIKKRLPCATHSTQKTCPQGIEHGALLSCENLSKQTSQEEPAPKLNILGQRVDGVKKCWKVGSVGRVGTYVGTGKRDVAGGSR